MSQFLYRFKVYIGPYTSKISAENSHQKASKWVKMFDFNSKSRAKGPKTLQEDVWVLGQFCFFSRIRFPTCRAGHHYKVVCCCCPSNSTLFYSQPGAIHYQVIESMWPFVTDQPFWLCSSGHRSWSCIQEQSCKGLQEDQALLPCTKRYFTWQAKVEFYENTAISQSYNLGLQECTWLACLLSFLSLL